MPRPIKTPDSTALPATLELSRRLSRFTAEKGWNQSDLAREASKHMGKGANGRKKKITRESISLYMRGLQRPQPDRLNALAMALGKEVDELMPSEQIDGAHPPFAMRPSDGDMVFLQVNQTVPLNLALEVAALLKKN